MGMVTARAPCHCSGKSFHQAQPENMVSRHSPLLLKVFLQILLVFQFQRGVQASINLG
jgi:hypothetical protein